jgi:hypothetical protein
MKYRALHRTHPVERFLFGYSRGFGCILWREDIEMPTTQHSAAAERHMQAAHAHQAAAASHNMNDHLGAHEQSRLAEEQSREAHKLSQELAREHAKAAKK